MLERKIYERHFEVELIGLRDLINEGVKDEKKKDSSSIFDKVSQYPCGKMAEIRTGCKND